MTHSIGAALNRLLKKAVAATALVVMAASAPAVDLADTPLFGAASAPNNVLLALSVEWPTAISAAYHASPGYSTATTYVGYFDPAKCYQYVYVASDVTTSYFQPKSNAVAHVCTSTATLPLWSGNYMNWSSMQTLDAFRWALTGGTRAVDSTTSTVLEKARQKHTDVNNRNRFPDRVIIGGAAGATPFTWDSVLSRVYGLDTAIQMTGTQPLACKFSSSKSWGTKFLCDYFGRTMDCTNGSVAVPNVATMGCQHPKDATSLEIYCEAKGNAAGSIDYSCKSGTSSATVCSAIGPAVDNSLPAYTTAEASCTAEPTVVDYQGESSAAKTAKPGVFYRLYGRVKVCDAAAGLESNCTPYGNSYKPEGLIQKYSPKLRFSVFSYLDDSNLSRDGGVMRAAMKFVGPTKPLPGTNSAGDPNSEPNPNAEWDPVTGIAVAMPDTQDLIDPTYAASIGLANSGVIGYVNNFGRLLPGDYKSYDPVSELYYAALRYYRYPLGPVPSYSNLDGATSVDDRKQWVDGFPVITKWTDPIIYSCQRNFILGLGDVNTHADANLYGSKIRTTSEPAMPGEVASDTAIDVNVATDMVGQLEGISGLASQRAAGMGTNSYFIAGLAYAAHTTDMRPDLPGLQTVDTFWVDVLETQTYVPKNQYWLAAKYGGFDIPPGFVAFDSRNSTSTLPPNAWHTTSDTMSGGGKVDPRPDNYFGADEADKMLASLTTAFTKIGEATRESTSTALATTSPDIASLGSANYAATYTPRDWSGNVTASTLVLGPGKPPVITPQWDAGVLLDAATLLPGDRKIVTCCTKTGLGLPFRAADLAAASFNAPASYASFGQVAGIGATQVAADFVDYLRGDHSREVVNGGVYRTRKHRLGDIVNARLNPVGPPAEPYLDASNPGYGKFRRDKLNRKTVVYAAANDGMVHAFDGSVPSGGAELFAYVPGFAFEGSAGAVASGLASLGNPTFVHHYLVDATPRSFDVDFARTQDAPLTGPDWRTVLIGGLGKGGKGYYAIDVTDPASWTSEGAVAGKLLWEFKDTRMGFSYGDADVVRTKKYGWVVIVSSGYGNADGNGYFFFLNPRTGKLLETVTATDAASTAPLDMGQQAAFLPDASDSLADAVYAGDLRGHVWRVDLTPTTGSYAAATAIAVTTDALGKEQPISARPLVDAAPNSKKRFVFVGTGRLLGTSDLKSTQGQSFYALIDGTGAWGKFAPAGSPTKRADLSLLPSLTVGLTKTKLPSARGWYFDFGSDAGTKTAERMTLAPSSNGGIVYGAIGQPTEAQCSAAGSARVFGLDFDSGQSVLQDDSGTLVASVPITASVVDLAIKSVAGVRRPVVGDDAAGVQGLSPAPKSPASLTRLDWREVPTAD